MRSLIRAPVMTGAQETHLVQPVVDGSLGILGEDADLLAERAEQRQCQVAMRDRLAKRASPAGTLRIDVDPLMVTGAVGELLDHGLIDD